MAIISEIGLEGIQKFPSAKQLTTWTRLAPNNKMSGRKVLSHHRPKRSSRLKIAFRIKRSESRIHKKTNKVMSKHSKCNRKFKERMAR